MTSPRNPSAGGFAAFGLAGTLVSAVTALGYEEPTPVQRETIPLLLSGRDMLGAGGDRHRQDGGLRAADAAPPARENPPSGRRRTRGLVLVPTRELAMQVAEAIHKYARNSGLSVVPVYGGASMLDADPRPRARRRHRRRHAGPRARSPAPQDARPRQACACWCSTRPTRCSTWALPRISTPSSRRRRQARQTALFSATMPPRILSIAERHLREPAADHDRAREDGRPASCRASGRSPTSSARAQKPAALQRVLDMESPTSALVFCRTRLEVDTLVETLNAHGYRAEALHGGMQQRQRDSVMERFRAAKADC